jgi:hypothetical protein
MWAWQVYEDGEWNLIAAEVGSIGPVPLITSRESNYELMRPIAAMHAVSSRLPVRGVRYGEPDVMEEL